VGRPVHLAKSYQSGDGGKGYGHHVKAARQEVSAFQYWFCCHHLVADFHCCCGNLAAFVENKLIPAGCGVEQSGGGGKGGWCERHQDPSHCEGKAGTQGNGVFPCIARLQLVFSAVEYELSGGAELFFGRLCWHASVKHGSKVVTILQALEADRVKEEDRVAGVSATKIQAIVRGRQARKVMVYSHVLQGSTSFFAPSNMSFHGFAEHLPRTTLLVMHL